MKTPLFALSFGGFCFVQAYGAENISTQIAQLQQQINQLQTQMSASDAKWVAVNSAAPLAAVGGANFAYSILQAQNQYTSPLTLGSYLEADLQTWGGSTLTGLIPRNQYADNGTVFAATSADLDALANVNQWTQAFITVQGGLNGYETQITEAFLNFGNLNKSPFYGTVGQTELPFGVFPGNGLLTGTPESNAFASTQLAQVDVGYSQGAFNTVFALFSGGNNLNNFVYSAQYQLSFNRFSLVGGAGYMRDIRYSGSDIAAAYGTSNGIYSTRTGLLEGGRNGAVDLNTEATYTLNQNQSVYAAAEWISTTNSPTLRGLDTMPGKMQAWSVTGGYITPIFSKSTTFALDYSATINMHAVPLQLPNQIDQPSVSIIGVKNQWLAYFQTEVLNNIYLGPEFARMNMYNGEHTWESTLDLSVYI